MVVLWPLQNGTERRLMETTEKNSEGANTEEV